MNIKLSPEEQFQALLEENVRLRADLEYELARKPEWVSKYETQIDSLKAALGHTRGVLKKFVEPELNCLPECHCNVCLAIYALSTTCGWGE